MGGDGRNVRFIENDPFKEIKIYINGVKNEIVSLANIKVNAPPLLFVQPLACVSVESVSVRSGKAHSSIWLQCVKL